MTCVLCGYENKNEAQICKKCNFDFNTEPLWRPTWKWHGRTLGIIYVVLAIVYFGLSHFLSTVPEPYKMRKIPNEITPWIKH